VKQHPQITYALDLEQTRNAKSAVAMAEPIQPDVESISSKKDHTLILPLEIKIKFIDLLPACDAKNLRLVSRAWAVAGCWGLFNVVEDDEVKPGVFIMRPGNNAMARLREIATRPHLAEHLRHLGVIGNAIEADESVESLKEIVKESIGSFDSYPKGALLSSYFHALPNVTSLEVQPIMTQLDSDWYSRYKVVLLAASTALKTTLRKLNLYHLPMELLGTQEEIQLLVGYSQGNSKHPISYFENLMSSSLARLCLTPRDTLFQFQIHQNGNINLRTCQMRRKAIYYVKSSIFV